MTFTKLFASITESTIWCEDDHTRLVWITMLAMANKNGFIFAAEPGLANRARVPLESVERALVKFLGPDRYSRSPEHEGRRIEKVDGGWRLLNYHKHRAIRDEEDRREYMRNLMRKKRQSVSSPVSNVSQCKPPLAQAEAEAEVEAEKSKPIAQLALSDEVYKCYPRKVGKRKATEAIMAAIARLRGGEYKGQKVTLERAVSGLKERATLFAESPAGKLGRLTPHAATWFNRSSYLDDPKEWQHEERQIGAAEQRANTTHTAIIDGLRNSAGKRNGNQCGQQQNDADPGTDNGTIQDFGELSSRNS